MNLRGTVDTSTVVEAIAAAVVELVDADDAALVRTYVRQYLSETDPHELVRRPVGELAGLLAQHWRLGVQFQPPVAVLVGPVGGGEVDPDAAGPTASAVMTVLDDVPFLVDSIHAVLTKHGLGIHLTVHPMLEVRRDADDRITDIGGRDGVLEAWTLVEFDACSPEQQMALGTEIAAVLADVRRSTADREPMRQRALALAAAVQRSGRPEADGVARFLTWITRQRFVFLAAERYHLVATRANGDDTVATYAVDPASQLGLLADDHVPDPPVAPGPELLAISRTDAHATVHRPSRMTCIAVRTFADDGSVISEDRLIGLFSTAAYRESTTDTPLLRDKADYVLDRAGFPLDSHGGRAVRAALESLPRDELFEIDPEELFELTMGIVALQERHLVRVFAVPEPGNRYVWCLVYLPRSRFTSSSADAVVEIVREAFDGETVEHDTVVGASALARIDVIVERRAGTDVDPDVTDLERRIDTVTTGWCERVEHELHHALGELPAHELVARLGGVIPADYQAVVEPADAVEDLALLGSLRDPGDLRTAVQARPGGGPDELRFTMYRRGAPVTLSAVLPYLENLGVEVVDQRPFEFHLADGDVAWISDIGIRIPADVQLDPDRAAEFQSSFVSLFRGEIENDGFNRLVVRAGLTGRQASVLRSYAKYLRQISFPFSQPAIESMLVRWPEVARTLCALFDARLNPVVRAEHPELAESTEAELLGVLDGIPSLDDDRIGRALFALVLATLRTNAFRPGADGGARPVLAFKLDPSRVPDLPLPRPMYEIFVSSPRVEGVHLRGGRIARGGLRWSDRREDFRTEILGLMKAQMVKNAVIVPVGAKGGFVVKQPPADAEALRAEVVACYRMFVSGLLDLTDNIVGDGVVPPPATVRYDGDDPYLVVAADKGTATFSDLANSISDDYGFWLGDAFASGGSAGYDHKVMGITARGAWESVRRHASVLGLDADRDPITIVGIGDMSGDVFGNGLLQSPHVKLLAAFDHRHIFLDPDPDPTASYAERLRLFGLSRSSWADYDASSISSGGGVFPRSAKVVHLTAEVRAAFAIVADALTPTELISALLRSPVDLLWNGGIGTYVKASTESHAEVGDRANDVLRVDADQLRCRMIGEGGNLGLTQRARVEFALRGGLVNTDAIDNSAGVDCSDHEVNIKILLDSAVVAGELRAEDRNGLLAGMTDEVAELVLADNRAQTRSLGIARVQAIPMVHVHARYLNQLELEGWLNRGLEFLPTEKQLAERQAAGSGLTTPEMAVLMAYTKIANIIEISETPSVDDAYFLPDLLAYFPGPLQERFRDRIEHHRLRREIVVTSLVNQMVNFSGTSFDHRMTEETGASSWDVLRAWVAARDIFGLPGLWAELEATSSVAKAADQVGVFLDARRMGERGAMWLLRNRRPPLDLAATVAEFAPGVRALLAGLGPLVRGPLAEQTAQLAESRLAAGLPAELARRSSVWPLMHTAFDTVQLAARFGCPPEHAAATYWQVFETLDVTWLWNSIGALPRADRWQTHARAAVRDDLLAALSELVGDVLAHGGDPEAWAAANRRAVDRATSVFAEIRRGGTFDLTTLTVANRQLWNLVLSTSPRGPNGGVR